MSNINASEQNDGNAPDRDALERERYELLQRLEDWLETPMLILAFVWLALLAGELIWGENLRLRSSVRSSGSSSSSILRWKSSWPPTRLHTSKRTGY